MVRRRFAFLSLGVAMALVVAACTSGPKPLAARTSQTVSLSTDTQRTTVSAKLAEELTLVLPPVDRPGYGWRLVGHDPRALKQSSEIVAATEPGGAASVKFITQRVVPRTFVRFMLVREGAREDAPVDSHEVVVSVQPEAPPKTAN